jgi:carbonyl reductase 1
MAISRTALVTGATQGLGLALVKGLAQRLRSEDVVLLTGRNPGRLDAAAASIGHAVARVEPRLLDVTDASAISRLAHELRKDRGGVDIVLSNAVARMTPDDSPASQIDEQIATNNLGTIGMLRSFVPVLKPGGRFLVVASSLGRLGQIQPQLRPQFDEATSLEDIERVLEAWRLAVHDGTAEQQGWPHWLNVPSKVAQVAAVRVVARQRRENDLAAGTLIASVCPGLIDTGASRPWFTDMSQAQTPDQAAGPILDVALAKTADPATYGELVRFGEVLSWDAEIPPGANISVREARAS